MADVLIFDDDPNIGDLVCELLRGQGLTVSHFTSAAGAVQLVQENKPRLVVLDIMMPGMDGLTACRTLKANPMTKAVKIAVLTAKDYREDRELASRYGADLFFNKPFDGGSFAAAVGKLLGFAEAPTAPRPASPPLAVTILRGAVILESQALLLIFDAGKGLMSWVERRTGSPPVTWFLMSRYQPDSVADAAAAGKLLAAGGRVNVAGPDDPDALLQRLAPYMCATLPSGARVAPLLYPQREGEFSLAPGVRAVARLTQHPGPCLAYRVEIQGRVVVYCPANEINPEMVAWNRHEHEKFRVLFERADLLIHGYRRSLEDSPPKDSFGRGAWEPVIDLAVQAKAKRLVLVPIAGASPCEGMQLKVEEKLAALGGGLPCSISRCDQRLIL